MSKGADMIDIHVQAKLLLAVATGLGGAVLGWSANALTMGGRVAALEATTARIEAMVVVLVRESPQPRAKPLVLTHH